MAYATSLDAPYIPLQASLSACKEACGGAINSTVPGGHRSADRRGHAPPLRVSLVRKRPDDDTEIDIFGAEKYFGAGEYASPICIPRAAAPVPKAHSSAWSETCSGNSRGGLLRPRQRKPLHQLGGLICCYSCSRNRDAIVVHKANSGGMNSYGSDRIDFSTASWRIGTGSQAEPWQWPSTNCNGKWGKEDALDTNRISESSSDLFEIESVCFGRGVGYERREASIDWSVATASAVNVSVASDRSREIGGHRERPQQGPGPRSGATASLLFGGCASQKAVRVVGARARRDQSAGGPGGAAEVDISSTPSARYHAVGGMGRVLPLRIARVLESPRTAR